MQAIRDNQHDQLQHELSAISLLVLRISNLIEKEGKDV
jgi:hypothetical protein